MKVLILIIHLFFISTIFGQFQNILISTINNPNEPSIYMDPNNTDRLVAGSNINNFYYSDDGGLTWDHDYLSSASYGVWGDPVLLIDNVGDIYFFHLSNPASGNWIDRIVCQKSTDNGVNWNDGTFMGLNGTKAQDKEWAVIDRNNENIYVSWTEFDQYGSASSIHKSRILFSKSTDLGMSWSSPIQLNLIEGDCIDDDDTTEGAVPAVGPNGEIYVAWSGPAGIRFNRSTDYGDTWLSEPIFIDDQPTGWAYDVPGIYRANGLPITVCDISGGPHNGTIYVNWSDQRNGSDDTDIWLKKSTDGGDTWSDLIRVNDDEAGNQQFFCWMDIDQTTGYIYIVFYDRRNLSGNLTDVYLARSTDGGETYSNHKISEMPFLPNAGVFFGDYTNITAHNGVIRPIWEHLNGTQENIYTAIIHEDDFIGVQEVDLSANISLYPNPAVNETYISFKLHKAQHIHIDLYDTNNKHIANILDNEILDYGKHSIRVNMEKYNLQAGLYYYVIRADDYVTTKKIQIL